MNDKTLVGWASSPPSVYLTPDEMCCNSVTLCLHA
jgi:hypothetical protein